MRRCRLHGELDCYDCEDMHDYALYAEQIEEQVRAAKMRYPGHLEEELGNLTLPFRLEMLRIGDD